MTQGFISELFRTSIFQVLINSAPVLLVGMTVGLIISILQATTSIQEQTLTFVPKIAAIMLTLAVLGGWIFGNLKDFTVNLFEMIPAIAGQ